MGKDLVKILAPVVFGVFGLAFLSGCASKPIRTEKRKIPGIGDTNVLIYYGEEIDYNVKKIIKIEGSKVTYIADGLEKTYPQQQHLFSQPF